VCDAEGELRRAQKRVAVGRRAQHRLGADAAAGAAGAVFDDDLLTEIAARLVSGEAAQQVGRAAGRIRNDERHDAVWIAALRMRGGDRGCDEERAADAANAGQLVHS